MMRMMSRKAARESTFAGIESAKNKNRHLGLFMAIIAMKKERPNAQCECGGTKEPAEQVP